MHYVSLFRKISNILLHLKFSNDLQPLSGPDTFYMEGNENSIINLTEKEEDHTRIKISTLTRRDMDPKSNEHDQYAKDNVRTQPRKN